MHKDTFVVSSKQYLTSIFKQLADAIDDHGFIRVEVSAGSNKSLPQLGLFWMWMGELAKAFTDRSKDDTFTKDMMHDLMCMKFLGETEITVGKTKITRLKSLRDLDKGGTHFFMEQVEAWASEHGVYLTRPADSEYMKLIERQNG